MQIAGFVGLVCARAAVDNGAPCIHRVPLLCKGRCRARCRSPSRRLWSARIQMSAGRRGAHGLSRCPLIRRRRLDIAVQMSAGRRQGRWLQRRCVQMSAGREGRWPQRPCVQMSAGREGRWPQRPCVQMSAAAVGPARGVQMSAGDAVRSRRASCGVRSLGTHTRPQPPVRGERAVGRIFIPRASEPGGDTAA
jgi:hypothetical protein